DIESENSPTYEKSSQKSPYEITGFSIPSKRSFERIRLADEDRLILQKAMQYAMSSLELARETKNTMSCVEESIQNLIQIITGTNDDNDDVTMPGVFTKQKKIKKWFLACQQYRVRRANDVRKIKTTMVNVLGKIAISDIPGQKASKKEVLTWKTNLAMLEAKSKLWVPVDLSEDADPRNIYIRRIITKVFRGHRSKLNQEFAIAVIDMMFDPTITTTSLTEECKDHSDDASVISHPSTPSPDYYNDDDTEC
ncbi:14452_t:CDS:2, partial [Racocetra fulgida]